jgi:flagella basal body P-ring formation protein FlgA
LTLLPFILSAVLAVGAGPEATSTERVLEAARQMLESEYPGDADRLEVRVVRLGGDVSETEPVTLRLRRPDPIPRGHVRVDIHGDGGGRTGWAILFVAHFDSLAVCTRSIAAGDPMTPDHVALKRIETTRLTGHTLDAPTLRALFATGPVFATKHLREGHVLRANDVRLPFDAEPGDRVLMTYRRAGMSLVLSCKAREAGATGSVIRLYSPETRSTYRARLEGPGQAEWIETL